MATAATAGAAAKPKVPAPSLRRLAPYWHEFHVRAKTRWFGRQILEVFTTEFRDRTKQYYLWAIHNGLCTVNGHTVDPTYLIQDCDMIVNRVHRHEPVVAGEPVRILHRDDEKGQLVVVKPGSVPVHATGRFRYHTLVEMVKEQAQVDKLYTSNRLDRLTSGIMICSTTKEAACSLGNDFNAGLVNKAYICRVAGRFPEGRIVCREPILAVDRQSGLNIVHPKGKDCETIFERLSYDTETDTSVLTCRPITGRTHQIRVHAQWLGHPICNDPLYCHPVWDTVDRDILATAQPRMYERVGGETGNIEIERVLEALKGSRDGSEGWARWRDDVIFGALNREAGYEDVYVPGPNGMPAEAPSGKTPPADERLCEVCRVPLLADPEPEELYIYLHAIKYWTDAWVFEDVLPWWARSDWLSPSGPDQYLPPLDLVSHHDGATVGKGGARRRNIESVQPQEWLVQRQLNPIACKSQHTVPPSLAVNIEVTRGLEDVALYDTLCRVAAAKAGTANPAVIEPPGLADSAIHCGVVRLDAETGKWAADLFTQNELPCALSVYYELSKAVLPQTVLDALFVERSASLGATRSVQERKAAFAPSESELLSFVRMHWEASQEALKLILPSSGGKFSLSIDRSSYVLPTMTTSAFEREVMVYLAESLKQYNSWEAAPREESSLHIRITMAARLGVTEELESGPSTRRGNPAGSLLIQVHVERERALEGGAVLRDAIASARAHSVASILPCARDATVIGVAGDDGPMIVALAQAMEARGISGSIVAYGRRVDFARQFIKDFDKNGIKIVHGQCVSIDASGQTALARVGTTLDAAIVELPERRKECSHIALFDFYYEDVLELHQLMRHGSHALLLTGEPRTMLRALRELENKSRRDEDAEYSLAHEPLFWHGTPFEFPILADGNEEARLRTGMRSFCFHRVHAASVVKRSLYIKS